MTKERAGRAVFRMLGGEEITVEDVLHAELDEWERQNPDSGAHRVCRLPPLPGRLSRVMSLGTRREVER